MIATQIAEFDKMLGNLERWLDKAAEFAGYKSFDPTVLLGARLAPDQYSLVRQVQAACDAAKMAAARLAGKDPPRHEDNEATLDELRARVASVRTYLATFTAADFAHGSTRVITLPFMTGKALIGDDYLRELAMPNFFFHVTTAYAILRHSGVSLGKGDFIGSLNLRDA